MRDTFQLERIRALRKARRLSQKKLADMLYISQNTYAQYELGKIGCPLEILKKLAGFYGTSVDYLLNRTDETKPYPAPKKR